MRDGRLLQAGIRGRGGNHVEAIDPRAAALHRQAQLDSIARRQRHMPRAALQIERHRHRIHEPGKWLVRDGHGRTRLVDFENETRGRVVLGARDDRQDQDRHEDARPRRKES